MKILPPFPSIVSPGRPTTRLMKSLVGSAEKPSPSVIQCQKADRGLRPSSTSRGFSNTMISPRLGSRNRKSTLFTRTRSPTRSVGSMDREGMKNA